MPKRPIQTDFWRRYKNACNRNQYEVHMPLDSIREFLVSIRHENDARTIEEHAQAQLVRVGKQIWGN